MAALIGKEKVAGSEGSNDKSSLSVLVQLLSHFKAKMHRMCPFKKSSRATGKFVKFSNKCFIAIPTALVFTGPHFFFGSILLDGYI
jgi:hypothetical protein